MDHWVAETPSRSHGVAEVLPSWECLVSHLPIAVALLDAEGRVLRSSPGWAGLFGSRFDGRWLSAVGAPSADVGRRRVSLTGQDGSAIHWDLVLAPIELESGARGLLVTATDVTEQVAAYEQLERRIAAFAGIADAMTLEHPLEGTLRQVARSVRSATGAEAAAVVVWEDEELRDLSAYGDDGLPEGYRERVEAAYAAGVDSPIRNVTLATDVTVIRDFRGHAEADPRYGPLHSTWVAMQFQDVVVVPLGARGRCVGCLLLYVAADYQLDGAERAFLQAIADQSAVAVENSRLFGAAESHATLVERQRLARELHDSVSQALFSMTMHARAAQRRLAGHGVAPSDPLATSLETLAALTRGALAEMRALIFELRPGALENEGLVVALTRQAAALSAREGLTITVAGPERRLALDPRTEEHLYRLVLEALHNTVKHAAATTVAVQVRADDAAHLLTVQVRDDGRGFDPASVQEGHLGQVTMRDRAMAVGGHLTVDSEPGAGCVVTVSVPVG